MDADGAAFFFVAVVGGWRVRVGGYVHVVVRDYGVCGFGCDDVAEEDDFAFRVAAVDRAGGGVGGDGFVFAGGEDAEGELGAVA